MGCCSSTPESKEISLEKKKEKEPIQYAEPPPEKIQEQTQNYELSKGCKILGTGSFSKVFLSQSQRDPNVKVAIKAYNKKKLGENLKRIIQEIQILKTLDHPNIVKHYETIEDDQHIYLVMEYCPNGELFDKIIENQYTEKDVCQIIRKLVSALLHCHAQGVVHRDVKPENIIMSKDDEIKLISFALSHKSNEVNTELKSIVGTPYYMAPEVIDGNYNYLCDLWSVGVLMYIMLSGIMPFMGNNTAEVVSKIKEANVNLNLKQFQKVSQNGKDLIKKLLKSDPDERLNGEEVLKHPWFEQFDYHHQSEHLEMLDPDIIESLKNYKGISKLKQVAMNLVVNIFDIKEIENLRQRFEEMDKDSNGMISAKELQECLSKNEMNLDEKEITDIINQMDFSGNKQINYSEFLAATINLKDILTEEKLKTIFYQFDINKNGFISQDELLQAMQKLEYPVTQEELDDILQKHDLNQDGLLSFDEFKLILLDKQ